jgi:hypothetical protein
MTDTPMPGSGSPHELLATTRDLTRRVRIAQRGTWFPLVLLGAVTLGVAPVDRYAGRTFTCTTLGGGRICRVYSAWAFVYWPIALVLAYVAITGFYLRRSASRGIGTRARPYVIAGIVLAVLLTAAGLWAAHNPAHGAPALLGLHLQPQAPLSMFLTRLEGPACAIGLALLVLARVERNWALLVFTFAYLAVVLLGIDFGWVLAHPSPWAPLPRLVITGGMLLLGGVGFALAERPSNYTTERPAP